MPETWPIDPTDLVDVALLWVVVWAGITWLRTSPARLALAGLAILGIVFLIARQLGLVMITWLLQGFFAVSVLIAVVVFQQDLRRLFEQIASLGPLRRRGVAAHLDEIDTLVRTLVALTQQRRGALVVIPGREPLERHVDGGVALDARVSEPLLLSIFDPHSPGHDGAVVLEGGRASRFAVHLPLSTDRGQLGQRGTRHAAALGLSERCDALCIVVSEERGVVSLAQGGQLETVDAPQQAGERIRDFLRSLSPEAEKRSRTWLRVPARWREALLALPLSAVLWFLVVPGSSRTEVEREVPVQITGLPPGYVLEAVEPESGRVQIAGLRRDLLLLDPDAIHIRVDAILADLGRRTFTLEPQNVVHPESVEILSVQPSSIRISVREEEAASETDSGAP